MKKYRPEGTRGRGLEMNEENAIDIQSSTTRRSILKASGIGLTTAIIGGYWIRTSTQPAAAIVGSTNFVAEDAIIEDNVSGIDSVTIAPEFGDPGNFISETGIIWENFTNGINSINVQISVWIDDPIKSYTIYDVGNVANFSNEPDVIEYDGHSLNQRSGRASFTLTEKDLISDTDSTITKDDFPQDVSDGEYQETTVSLEVTIEFHGDGENAVVSAVETFDVGIDNPSPNGGYDGMANTGASGA